MEAKNPCIRRCEYNDDNLCVVCLRTKKEIFEWGDYTDEQKIVILERIKEQKEE